MPFLAAVLFNTLKLGLCVDGDNHKEVASENMKVRILALPAAYLCTAGVSPAATVNWTTSPGVADTEISTFGSQVFGYYFNVAAGLPSTVIVNTVPFTLIPDTSVPAGLDFGASYNNAEGVDLYQVPPTAANAGLNQILDGQNWGNEGPLTVINLQPGSPYQLQFMISDDRPAFLNGRNYDVSDSADPEGLRDIEFAYHSTRGGGVPVTAPAGSREAKIFTGSFVADATGTQEIYNVLYGGTDHNAANSGSQVNAIQVRLIPEPTAAALAALGFGLLCLRRRRRSA